MDNTTRMSYRNRGNRLAFTNKNTAKELLSILVVSNDTTEKNDVVYSNMN